MERPPKYVMILFPPCDFSLTPHMHGEEVYCPCFFGLFFVVFIVFESSSKLLRCQHICAFCNATLRPQGGALCSEMFYSCHFFFMFEFRA